MTRITRAPTLYTTLISMTRSQYNLAIKESFIAVYSEIPEAVLKNLHNGQYIAYHISRRGHDTSPWGLQNK